MASSSSRPVTQGSWSQHQYPFPSHVNHVGFMSVKLSGKHDYVEWREQMVCLLKCHDMYGFVDGTILSEPMVNEWRRSNTLVQGWIFGSLSKDVMTSVVGLQTALDIWEKLETNYNTSTQPAVPMWTTNTNTRKKGYEEYFHLCTAIQNRDWKTTKTILENDNDALNAMLNVDGDKIIHLAIGENVRFGIDDWRFVDNLLHKIHSPEALPLMVNYKHQNALHYAARLDNITVAHMLIENNPRLLFKVDINNYLPITMAAFHSQERTFRYLLNACQEHIKLSEEDGCHNPFEDECGVLLLTNIICSGYLDVAYELINKYPKLALIEHPGTMGLLWCIAQVWNAFPSGQQYNFFQRFVYNHITGNSHMKYLRQLMRMKIFMPTIVFECLRSVFRVLAWIHDKFWKFAALYVMYIKVLHKDKVKHNTAFMILSRICEEVSGLQSDTSKYYEVAFLTALENDTPEAIHMIIKTFPQSVWISDVNGHNIHQYAIKNRCENVYNFLVHEVTSDKIHHNYVIDKDGNNLLHLAAQLAPLHKLHKVTGAALQMQRELQWFQEVRKLLRPEAGEKRNQNNETPMMVFTREHSELRQKGEEWMKKTAESCSIIAVLIITIGFAAGITVPGGNNGETGQVIYRNNSNFIGYIYSVSVSLFASTTSLLLFSSILMARYSDDDFLYKLPKRLILGLIMLFVSVTFLMIAFGATLNLMFHKPWILIPIAIPIISFMTLQLPLLADLISSTYGHGVFGKRGLEIEAKRVRIILAFENKSAQAVLRCDAYQDTSFQSALNKFFEGNTNALQTKVKQICFDQDEGWGSLVYYSLK